MKRLYKIGERQLDHPSNDRFRLHFHNHYEIYLLLEGDAKYIVEEKNYPLSPYDIIVIRRNQMHRVYHNTPSYYHRIVLMVHPQFFQTAHCEEYEQIFLDSSPDTGNRIDAGTVRRSGLYDAFQRIRRYSDNFTNIDTPIVQSVLIEILYLLNHITLRPDTDPTNTRLKEIITYLNQHFSEDVSLDDLAQRFFLSKYHLCHIFLAGTGLTVHQYITNKRLTKVDELAENGIPIQEAALQAGFNHYSSFYRSYKKKYGYSPKNRNIYENSDQ